VAGPEAGPPILIFIPSQLAFVIPAFSKPAQEEFRTTKAGVVRLFAGSYEGIRFRKASRCLSEDSHQDI
jgi:hypothetical protein